MSDALVLRARDGGGATLTLNRPEKLNALTPASFVALRGQAARIGLVDRAVPDGMVAELTAEICRNSRGTNVRVKRLIAVQGDMPRTEALLHGQGLPFGTPEDVQDRMNARR